MGKRMKGGTCSPFGRAMLLHRIKSCNLDTRNLSIDQIVEHLRFRFPDYSRIKQQPFTRHVIQTLQQPKSESPYLKPRCKEDEDCDDEQLVETENKFLKRRKFNIQATSSQSSILSDESGNLTSEDAIFEEPLEPEVDLIKSLMRTNYSASLPVSRGKADDEKVEKAPQIDFMGIVKDEELHKDLKGISGGKVEEGPRFRDLAGMKDILDELLVEVILPLKHPVFPLWLGVQQKAGILLHGPPGCGKTKLAHAIANETGLPFYKLSATDVVSGVSGASEENIRDLFSRANRTAPSIVFIDEIDVIASKRENVQREMERRIVTQLMTCMDESNRNLGHGSNTEANPEAPNEKPGYILVIGATNRLDAIDPAVRRPGRFDWEIALGIPNEDARMEILSVVMKKLRLQVALDLRKIARLTPGFVGADLVALANKAGNLAIRRFIDGRKTDFTSTLKNEESNEEWWWKHPWTFEELETLSITMADIEIAAKMVQPSLRREGFSTIPDVKWDDIGGLRSLKEEFKLGIVGRIKYPEVYVESGVDLETGFLLYGPPGCGKTLVAMALANETGANFIHIKGPEILNKYVGESELAIRTIFGRARSCAPCIIFFDEVDALMAARGSYGSSHPDRLVDQLLVELNGVEPKREVFVIGATNRLEVIDPAVLRTGRLGKVLYVPLPGPSDRASILKTIARKKPIATEVDLDVIGRSDACQNLSGADLFALVNRAALTALKEKLRALSQGISTTKPFAITTAHFEEVLKNLSPSVTDEQRRHYEAIFQMHQAGQ